MNDSLNENRFTESNESIDRKIKKKNIIITILIIASILFLIAIIVLMILFFGKSDGSVKPDEKKEEKIFEYFYSTDEKDYKDKNTYENSYTLNNGTYNICAYGASALYGGRGCVMCGKFKFMETTTIKYQLGGREAGGEGGFPCGETGSRGYNGAGMALITYSNQEVLIAAGGGGGSSETAANKGGDCEGDGEGNNGGKKGEIDKGGRSGGNGQDGKQYYGGDASYLEEESIYCGGGGGNGYFGGGSGAYGKGYGGGGGGGSNFCNSTNCYNNTEIKNKRYYSGIEIYKIDE